MHDELKGQLDKSVPKHITLTELKKREILREAQNETAAKRSFQLSKMMPALAGAAVIGLSILFGASYITEWSGYNGEFAVNGLEKVTIPNQPYPVLVNAEYEDQQDVLIYTDNHRIYSYDVDAKTETVLAEASENAKILELEIEDEWIVWSELAEENGVGSSSLKILNRVSGESQTVENIYANDLRIDGSILSYLALGVENKTPAYKLMDLATLEEPFEHMVLGEGAGSQASFENGLLVVPERVGNDGELTTTFFVYSAKEQTRIGEFTVPYETALNVTVTDNKIFAQLSDVEKTNSVLAYIDLKTEELVELETPDFWDYAVYGNYVALSIPQGDSDTVKLYEIEGTAVKELPAFNAMKERLVKPRFSEGGTLLVNGEGEEFSMYLQDTEALE